eukprot:12903290-Prorocentrum_lima.AAC.1
MLEALREQLNNAMVPIHTPPGELVQSASSLHHPREKWSFRSIYSTDDPPVPTTARPQHKQRRSSEMRCA